MRVKSLMGVPELGKSIKVIKKLENLWKKFVTFCAQALAVHLVLYTIRAEENEIKEMQ